MHDRPFRDLRVTLRAAGGSTGRMLFRRRRDPYNVRMKRTAGSPLIAFLGALLGATPTAAQVGNSPAGLSGLPAELVRVAEIDGRDSVSTVLFRRHSETWHPPGAPWFVQVLPVELTATRNSGWADDRYDGLLWAGRGGSASARFGLVAGWRWLTVALQPEIAGWENLPYDIRAPADTLNPFHHPFYNVDLPQRMGPDGGSEWSMGQSYARVDVKAVGVGYSNENLWTGPATRYPILMSNAAPGFPHFFAETTRPLDIVVGSLHVRGLLGWTRESVAFDTIPANDFSNLFAWGLAVRPRGLEWLEVGVQRFLHYSVNERWGVDPRQVFDFLQPSDTNRWGNELAGIYMRAVLPESRVEFYAEWTRDDRFAGWFGDFIPEPDHSQGYMLGVQKIVGIGSARLRLRAETVDLQEQSELRLGAGRPLPTYYNHGQVIRGYTHRGQVLGAFIGPGSDAQFLGADVLTAGDAIAGLWVERVRRNDARPTRVGLVYDERDVYPFRHDVEVSAGARAGLWLGDVNVAASAAWARRYHRLFLQDTDDNVRLTFDLSWWPERSRL